MIEVPTFDELMWPAIVALRHSGGSASNEELLSLVTEQAHVPDDLASLAHTDGRQSKLSYNLAWTKSYLKKAGLLTNSQRGVWSLTVRGETADRNEVEATLAEVRKAAYELRKQAPILVRRDPVTDLLGDDSTVSSWREQLLATLKIMDPSAFERLSQRMLRESGFVKVEVTGRSGDGGIDGVGVLRLNLLSFIVLFQCKRFAGTVSSNVIRDFRGAMVGRGDKGLVITTGTFSADARREATRDGAPAIDLIDGDQLCTLLKDLKLGVKTELVERVLVDQTWFGQV